MTKSYWQRVAKLVDSALYDLECRSAAEPSELKTLKGIESVTKILERIPKEEPSEEEESNEALSEDALLILVGDKNSKRET